MIHCWCNSELIISQIQNCSVSLKLIKCCMLTEDSLYVLLMSSLVYTCIQLQIGETRTHRTASFSSANFETHICWVRMRCMFRHVSEKNSICCIVKNGETIYPRTRLRFEFILSPFATSSVAPNCNGECVASKGYGDVDQMPIDVLLTHSALTVNPDIIAMWAWLTEDIKACPSSLMLNLTIPFHFCVAAIHAYFIVDVNLFQFFML